MHIVLLSYNIQMKKLKMRTFNIHESLVGNCRRLARRTWLSHKRPFHFAAFFFCSLHETVFIRHKAFFFFFFFLLIFLFCSLFFHIHAQDHTKYCGGYLRSCSQTSVTASTAQTTMIYWHVQNPGSSQCHLFGWAISFYKLLLSATL